MTPDQETRVAVRAVVEEVLAERDAAAEAAYIADAPLRRREMEIALLTGLTGRPDLVEEAFETDPPDIDGLLLRVFQYRKPGLDVDESAHDSDGQGVDLDGISGAPVHDLEAVHQAFADGHVGCDHDALQEEREVGVHVSPSVGGSETPTVGAPGAAPPVAAPGTSGGTR